MKNQSIIRILCGNNDSSESEQKDSNMLTQATYDRKQATLTLTYNGTTYRYYNVPMYVFNNLVSSTSREEFYEQNIKNVFRLDNQNNL